MGMELCGSLILAGLGRRQGHPGSGVAIGVGCFGVGCWALGERQGRPRCVELATRSLYGDFDGSLWGLARALPDGAVGVAASAP